MVDQLQDSSIFRCARRASLLKNISFAGKALGPIKSAKLLPEIKTAAKYFGYNSLPRWRLDMELDNSIAERSVKLGLCSRLAADSVVSQSLDDYMLAMHADILARVFESFTAFADRMIPLIQSDPSAPEWWLDSQILVQRRHWCLLARRVTVLVRIVLDRLDKNMKWKQSSLPGEIRLREAARAAALAYG